MRIIGIDPGVTGAIALVQDTQPAEVWDIPSASVGNTKQMSAQSLVEFITAWGEVDGVFVEDNRAQGHNGALANFSMGMSLGTIFGVCATLRRPVYRVKPREWQTTMGLTQVKRVDRKNAHRQRARELFPALDEALRLVRHHNRADALLIAEHGRRTLS